MSDEITKDNFVWKTKDKEVGLDEMDVNFKLIALIHSIKNISKNYNKYEYYIKKKEQKYKELQEELNALEEEIKSFKQREKRTKSQAEAFSRKSEKLFENVEYFQNLADVLEKSLLEDHALKVPDNIDDLWAFKRMYEKGIIKKTG